MRHDVHQERDVIFRHFYLLLNFLSTGEFHLEVVSSVESPQLEGASVLYDGVRRDRGAVCRPSLL